jgi:hypothetical protein
MISENIFATDHNNISVSRVTYGSLQIEDKPTPARNSTETKYAKYTISLMVAVASSTFIASLAFRTGILYYSPSPSGITGADITMLHNSHSNLRHRSAPITLSVWLYPPQAALLDIQDQIDMLAEDRGPSFLPHVTLIGGIPCQSEEQALQMGRALQHGLRGFGEVPCHFSATPKTSEGVWSQALYLTMDETDLFIKLCETCRVILGFELPCTFAPPAHKPHMSLFYGVTDIPDASEVEPVKSFEASTIAIWTTGLSTLASVPNWKEMSVIKLA